MSSALMQEATRILAVRHGETEWNAQQRIQGHTDIPLNAVGRQQARQLARALAGEAVDAVYSSDLQRARATAQAAAEVLQRPVTLEPGLRERGFGPHLGGHQRQSEPAAVDPPRAVPGRLERPAAPGRRFRRGGRFVTKRGAWLRLLRLVASRVFPPTAAA